ncbi:LysR family transcriptional regulator [Variovorax sp. J2P1-59]|uniref:LysR family transcriptional regulator n=1 Tax=Variovorax flavidus TaxID=3053501 RepID=UPI002577B8A2|nr:LysR family transcriptional regulator [Variovorax sp. J2P1-59]MDM0078145.1 LysR family transcriptional regulator [Variovorax sp. J2P1-59]
MDAFDNIAVFLAIYESNGLSAAARQLNRSLQAVSRALMGLEGEMGVQLIRRTTRHCTPTEAGVAFYHRVKPAYAELREAKLEVANRRVEPKGLLRVGASVQFAPTYLVPIAAKFMKRFPMVNIEVVMSDNFVDMIEANLDLALRIGTLPDSDLRARRLGEFRRVVYGSPSYFAQHGRPEKPDELKDHQCVVRTAAGSDAKWPFLIDGGLRSVSVSGRFRASDSAAVVQAVVEGLGIGFTPLWQIRDLLERSKLELVLTTYEVAPVPIHAVWAEYRHVPAKTRQFIDFLEAEFVDDHALPTT